MLDATVTLGETVVLTPAKTITGIYAGGSIVIGFTMLLRLVSFLWESSNAALNVGKSTKLTTSYNVAFSPATKLLNVMHSTPLKTPPTSRLAFPTSAPFSKHSSILDWRSRTLSAYPQTLSLEHCFMLLNNPIKLGYVSLSWNSLTNARVSDS